MADVIHLLPDHVANQIAAGEVVQRPASVVKELLENAIDAHATEVGIQVKEAGKVLIQVSDNGKGMTQTDARRCFERHATSKINSAEDLFRLRTKGFRGEALASIAAIAHVELRTRMQDQDVGSCVRIEGSAVVSQEPCVTSPGTTISVKNLFYNIPARRNFLKSTAVELRHIIDEFHRVALAHPSIKFSLFNDGAELFQLNPGNHRQRIVAIFGGKTNEKLVPVEEETAIVKFHGYVGKPEFAKKSRGEQFFFVNDRFIKSPYLNHAVAAAFEGLLREKAHPAYFLFLEVDPKTIDINIHPTKTEIKFDDEHALYTLLRSAIKHSLGQFNIAPVLDFEQDPDLDPPYEIKRAAASAPRIEVDPDFNPFRERNSSYKGSGGSSGKTPSAWEGLYSGVQDDFAEVQEFNQMEFESDAGSPELFSEAETESGANTFQLNKKYIVSTLRTGILVIDQHRAHSRILYEEFLRNITVTAAVSQQLLFPLELQFTKEEVRLLQQQKEVLQQMGFVFADFRKDLVVITGIPTRISESEVTILLEHLLSDLENEVPEGFSQNDLLAKSLARSMAVKSGTSLDAGQQQNIINSLFACKEPAFSPNNKPVFVTLTLDELDKRFL